MTLVIDAELQTELTLAHRIRETIVLRTKTGAVYTVDIGESLLPDPSPKGASFGGKVTLAGNPPRHVGVCHGENTAEVFAAAQKLIVQSLSHAKDAVPKPHFRQAIRSESKL